METFVVVGVRGAERHWELCSSLSGASAALAWLTTSGYAVAVYSGKAIVELPPVKESEQ